ncbi:MAG: restriction endonuclease, SacI family [Planctomycetaceae bacterium]
MAAIAACVNSGTKTYRYVLPTQLVAKIADPNLDARSVQAAWSQPGAFDARSVAHEVIVPFDRENHNVLGGSAEPYVSKPLREEAVIPEYRSRKKDKTGWDNLCQILKTVQAGVAGYEPEAVFDAVLQCIAKRLEIVRIVYPAPNRISLTDATSLIFIFLTERSGGVRFEAVVAALFESIGQRFRLFESVRRSQVNTADQQAGAVADVECLDADGRVVIAVESKDREVTVRQIEDKLSLMREQQIREAFFLSSVASNSVSGSALDELLCREFNSGQNIYILQMDRFLESMLSLFGETGRTQFFCRRSVDSLTRTVGSSTGRNGRSYCDLCDQWSCSVA